jgi:hypothetical protein
MKRISIFFAACCVAACGTDVSGPSISLYPCVFGDVQTLEPGEAVWFGGVTGRAPCLGTGGQPATFLYIPFFEPANPMADKHEDRLALDVLGAGLLASSGAAADHAYGALASPGSGLLPAVSRPTDRWEVEFHGRLRQREIEELEPRIRATARVPDVVAHPGLVVAPRVPEPGDLMELNVALSCTRTDFRTGRVQYVSSRAIMLADTANPGGPGSLTAQDYANLAMSFDTLVYPVTTRHFGEPSDIDGNGRTLIFFTRAVNELTPRGSQTYTAALFWGGDLFPHDATGRLEGCAGSNQAEMFYMAVPDPWGLIGPKIEVDRIRSEGVKTLGHEFQHLLNAARRLYVNDATRFEQTWLNEGLSHITEELLFREVSGLGSGSNIGIDLLRDTPSAIWAFNRFMNSNYGNLSHFLARPDTASLMGADRLATRGAAWSFLRYAADRSGAADERIFHDLLNSRTAGLQNLDAVLGVRTLDWIQDWTVALYADDHVPGVLPRHQWPSWNFRDIYQSQDQPYPLLPGRLAATGARRLSIQPGSAGYLIFDVDAHSRAALHVESDAGVPRTLRGLYLRVR